MINKKGILVKFLLFGLLVPILIFVPIFIKGCEFMPLGVNYKQTETEKMALAVEEITSEESNKNTILTTVKLEEEAYVYFKDAAFNSIKIDNDGQDYVVSVGQENCLRASCICYCEKQLISEEADIKYLDCKPGREFCYPVEGISFQLPTNGEGFFGDDGDNDIKYEGGVAFGRDLKFSPDMGYRYQVKFQKIDNGKVAVCSKKQSCFDPFEN